MNRHQHTRDNPKIVIIGAGMSGICLAIKFQQQGFTDITLLEKAETLGGTWRENRYPGLTCDVPSHAYTYSFAPNPDWTHLYPPRQEIFRYFDNVFHHYGVAQYTHFNEAVTACHYRETQQQWEIITDRATYTADFLFAATGILHHPVYPDIPGRDTFKGISMHSARWREEVDFKHKRIGVIGTGSTATQLIPELINTEGSDVTVFQRTAQWIIHTPNPPFSERTRRLFRRFPFLMRLNRSLTLWMMAQTSVGLTGQSRKDRLAYRLIETLAKNSLKRVRDPLLRQKLTPDYKPGCKRLILNATFYPAIQKPNAHVVTENIRAIETEGVRTADGTLHALDILIYATGFNPVAYMRPMDFTGKQGLRIEEVWNKKLTAYRSLMIPGFPNFFCMVGPNSPIGNFSIISVTEAQADWCLQLIKQWQAKKLDTVECTETALQNWRNMLQAKMKNTVWASGCVSWYLDKDGDPITWPDSLGRWKAMMQRVEREDFVRQATDIR